MSEVKSSLYKKIVRVMGIVGQIEKDGEIKDRSGKLMYRYLSEEATTSALQKAFVEVGLALFPVEVETTLHVIDTIKYEKPAKAMLTEVRTKYKIVCADTGEFEILSSMGYGQDDGDKGSNKALTNALKYMQRQTFAISTDAHDDADAFSSDDPSRIQPPKPRQLQSAPSQSQASAIKDKMSSKAGEPVTYDPARYATGKSLWIELQGSEEGYGDYVTKNGLEKVITALEARKAKKAVNA